MSAVTPLPPMPPGSVPAVRSPFRFLVADPCIALSWLLFIGVGIFGTLSQRTAPATIGDAIGMFLSMGYAAWSMYFGLAACWRLGIRNWRRIAALRFSYGWIAIPVAVWLFTSVAVVYAAFGGGIYHFARRWWLLAHGEHPPFLRAYP